MMPDTTPAAPPPATLLRWDAAGFTLPTPSPDPTTLADPASRIVERFLRSGGLLGGGSTGGGGTTAWHFDGESIKVVKPDPASIPKLDELPGNWLTVEAARKESAFIAATVDVNALRTSTETLFDAPWMQRTINRLALNNARTVSIRAAILPPPADNLPPLLELKAVASARSEKPGTPLIPIKLIAPGWGGSKDEAAAIAGATWAASIRSDSGGIGQIGRDGGVGTWAGLIRLTVDVIGSAQTQDTKAWDKTYTQWQDRSSEALRSISTRLQSRATLACFGSAAAPDLVLIIPARPGERLDTLTKAIDALAPTCSLTSNKGVWTNAATGPLTPGLAITVSGAPATAYLVVSLEHDPQNALLQQTASRLRTAK